MKKILITLLATTGLSGLVLAQDPAKSLSVQEAKALNGTSQPVMSNGKPYSQWVAEEKAKKQQAAIAVSANRPKGLPITPNSEMADPAAQRMNEPVQYGVKVVEDKGATDPGNTVDATLVKTEVKQSAATPEVPAQFRMPENASWGNAPATELPVRNNVAPQIISDPAQAVNAQVISAPYKTPVLNDVNKASGNEGIKPAEKKNVSSSIVAAETKKAAPVPDVPAQFRMPENAGWGNAAATEKPVRSNVALPQINGDPAQSPNAPVSTEVYKTPQVKDANMNNNKKDINPAEAKATIPAAVVSNKQPATANPAPEVPSQFRLPATQSWNGRPVATEAPANSLVTEKAASRTAADAPKSAEVSADKVQKPPAEKNTTPVPAAAGAGNGETSKVTVPGVIYPQQEVPKKD